MHADTQRTAEAAPAGHAAIGAEDADWATLTAAADLRAYCHGWLAIQCRLIPDIWTAVVLVRSPGSDVLAVAASWPGGSRDASHLTAAARKAMDERQGVVLRQPAVGGAAGRTLVGYPIESEGRPWAVVALDAASRPEGPMRDALRQLHWGAAGLELMACRQALEDAAAARARQKTVLEVIAASTEHARFTAAATALATELATRLHCSRVSIGFVHRGQCRIEAVSHSAQFKRRTDALRAVEAAMDEALDQRSTVASPPVGEPAPAAEATAAVPVLLHRAHDALAAHNGGGACCTVLLAQRSGTTDEMADDMAGAITLERQGALAFEADTVALCEAVAALAGPMLARHRRDDLGSAARALDSGRAALHALLGPRHWTAKLLAIGLPVLAALLLLVPGTFRVSAPTVLEPSLLLAATSPIAGYIREAPVRAGDRVASGAIVARLDDRDLQIERLKWTSQHSELEKTLRQALADGNGPQLGIVGAQLEQAAAQVARVDEQLARAVIKAPFDGLVVSGDLSQKLGSPVERGAVLFEVAPLEGFRLVLKVDESDIAHVHPGQRGTLLNAALPNEPVGFTVTAVTPVANARDGRNTFRVEARLDATDVGVRPNMEGVGKIDVDRRSLLWIWTRQTMNAARLLAWSWLP